MSIPENFVPILPLRDIVVFPYMIVPLFVGREKSIKALEAVMSEDKKVLLLAQKDGSVEDPSEDDLYKIGTIGNILQLLKLPDGTVKVLVEGISRASVQKFDSKEYLLASTSEKKDSVINDKDEKNILGMVRAVKSQFEQYSKLNKKITTEVLNTVDENDDPAKISDLICSNLDLKMSAKQELLELDNVISRLEKILKFIEEEQGVLQAEKRIRNRVKRQMEKTQRDYYLNEQMKAIQKELGDSEDGKNELDEINDLIKKSKLPKHVLEKTQSEIKKLKNMSPMSAEATVIRNYLDWILSVPWSKKSRLKNNLAEAQKILDGDHFGIEKVKERIIEYLAVQKRTGKIKGPLLCLVGPPGVGKTSLGKSIANATGRKFVRMSLGGVRDEAEIRGHRRTYIGSMPGRIIQALKKAGTNNPLILLDEVDKLGADWRGDPSSALLEVLDPEQNNTFQDHYLEVDCDLSNVMFVTTANSLNMPKPLLDRMEIIRLSGYTELEKLEIAKSHLLPKVIKDHALKKEEFSLSDKEMLEVIRSYTREAGVRGLEREISKLSRKLITEILLNNKKKININQKILGKFLGVPKFKHSEIEDKDMVGITTGLAWTEVGGELLTIESALSSGKGKISSTGKLGDVMKESIQAAEAFVRSRANSFGISMSDIQKSDIHVHVPEGATPKDGPSAGVAMITSIISSLTGNPVKHLVAMTGEMTLRGRVLPIGGLKEKLLAASRGGVKTVIIPKENEKDLSEIPDNIKDGLYIKPVSYVDEALEIALVNPLIPIVEDNAKSDKETDKGLNIEPSTSKTEITAH